MQDVRQMLFIDAGETLLDEIFVRLGFGLLAQMLDGTDEKTAGAARRVEDGFPPVQARIHLLDDELRYGARRVELAGIAR
jgi:hypothetical protein